MKTYLKTLFRPKPYLILAASALFIFGADRLIRTQTHGFRLEKTRCDYPENPNWMLSNAQLEEPLLDQAFYFLGSGVQCYAFLGEDQKTVLKLFKHYHFGLPSSVLKKFPFPPFAKSWQTRILEKRRHRIEKIFTSACIAHDCLPRQTQLLHLNLNPKAHPCYPTITIYDNIGIQYNVNLNTTPFALQKKATPLLPYLEEHHAEAKSVLSSLFSYISKRKSLGISNKDRHLERNFGVIDRQIAEIDIGSFTLSEEQGAYEMPKLKKWIQKNTPELNAYFEQEYPL